MSALELLLLMISSFQYVQSFHVISQNETKSFAYWNSLFNQCVTEWGIYPAGSVVHVFQFHGNASLVCKDGELGFDLNRSYVEMYGVKIPANGKYKTTKCADIRYRIFLDRLRDGKTLMIKFQVDMDEIYSPTVCIIKEYESCSSVHETSYNKECSRIRCSGLGEFLPDGTGCLVKDKCFKTNERVPSYFWWRKRYCICLHNGKVFCAPK